MCDRHIIVDPVLLAVPDSEPDYTEYLDQLTRWLECLSKNRDFCSIPEQAMYALWDSDRYPSRDRLNQIIELSRSTHISLADVLNMVRILAETEPFLEHHIGVRTAVSCSRLIDPVDIIARHQCSCGEAFATSLLLAGWAQQRGWSSRSLRVATKPELSWPSRVEISGVLTLVEKLDGSLEEFEQTVSCSLGFLCDPAAIEDDIRLQDIWRDVAVATNWVFRNRLTSSERVGVTLPRITSSDRFEASVEANNIPSQSGVLETLYLRVLLAALGRLSDVKGAKLHAVRSGRGADDPQVTRSDGAKLWRCMLTQRGAGYRLHYWELKNGAIELEAVMVESECS